MNAVISATAENEAERLKALHALDLLDTEEEPEFDELVSLASAICEVPISVVSLMDADRQWFKAQIGLAIKETPRAIAFCTHTLRQNDVMVVEDATADDRFANNPFVTGDSHIRFYAGMPVRSPDGHAVGTLCILDNKPRKLTNGQITALRILASQANARIEIRVQRKKLEKALADAEHARLKLMASEERFRLFMDNSPIVSHIKDEDGRLVFYNRLFAERFNISREEWLGKSNFELWPEEEARQLQKSDDEVLQGKVLHARRISIHEKIGMSSTWKSYKFPLTTIDGPRLVGVVGLEITEDLRREEELQKSKQELERANKLLEQIASTDALTGVRNRRAFDQQLYVEFNQSKRKARVMSVLLLDVDNFKRRNDLYGHPEGDATLKKLADLLRRVARTADTVARYGGEEFAILLPETTEEQGLQLAGRLCDAIHQETWNHEPVTVSMGVASMRPSMRHALRLVALADEALYVAKRAGKDRAVGYAEYFESMLHETASSE